MMALSESLVFGSVTVSRIEEITKPMFDPLDFFTDCTPEILAKEIGWLAPRFYDPASKLLKLTNQSYLLCSGGVNILVDACVGNYKLRKRAIFNQLETSWMDQLLAVVGSPENINVVVSTHLHVDHVGWYTTLQDGCWVPTFPRARYLFVKMELDFFSRKEATKIYERNGDYWTDSIQPVLDAGLADIVSDDYRIDDCVSLVPAPGETPGTVAVKIEADGRELAIITGDIFHHILQCKYPDWNSRFSQLQDAARKTRLALFDRCADTNICILSGHMPSPSAGYIQRQKDGYKFRFV